ncbi:GpE family phage tail protein [Aquitalea sp. ASV11]
MALVFHWPPSAYENMPLAELADWREQARRRWETEDT